MIDKISIPLLPSESLDDIYLSNVPGPLELLPGYILKIPIKELNECTYILTKHICGLHISNNRLTIQTSVPCQGVMSHCIFIVPANQKKALVDFLLDIIKQNQNEGL